jgi:sec-independent protein translocase protein TatA
MDLGAPELLIILVVVLVLFGGKKLPDLARSLGSAKREFQEGVNDKSDDKSDAKADSTADENKKA